MRKNLLLQFGFAGSIALAVAVVAVEAQSALPLVQESQLVWQGAFRLPPWSANQPTYAYGGHALAFNSSRGTLFLVGHRMENNVGELSIPSIRPSAKLTDLATATVVQPLSDILEGRTNLINPTDPNWKWIGGLAPYKGKLYFSLYSYYDGAKTQVLSHFVSGVDLSARGDIEGPFQVGTVGAGFIDGYFGEVPADLVALLGGPVVNGQCCIGIVTRTSYGPALFAIDPTDIGVKHPVPATPLVYYPRDHFVNDWNVQSNFFNGATKVTGVVIPSGTRSVLFFGRQGLGPFCYGTGAECGDPVDSSKGTHAYPYVPYVWAYDALELAAVRRGERHPWDVRPYATWKLTFPFSDRGTGEINGAAFDPATGRIFVTQAFADGSLPVVHVFSVASEGRPQPPRGVHVER